MHVGWTNGVRRIAAERRHQIEDEGCTREHDAQHITGELVKAAIAYAIAAIRVYDPITREREAQRWWPFDDPRPPEQHDPDCIGWNPDKDPVVNLRRAGALIAAEIDRIGNANMRVYDHRTTHPSAGGPPDATGSTQATEAAGDHTTPYRHAHDDATDPRSPYTHSHAGPWPHTHSREGQLTVQAGRGAHIHTHGHGRYVHLHDGPWPHDHNVLAPNDI